MAEARRQDDDPAAAFRADPWSDRGEARVIAVGDEPRDVVRAALDGVLALALDDLPPVPAGDATAAAPIAGQGSSLEAAIALLADALLAQLDLFGGGLRHVRLDGLLRTDAGGYSGWGYLVGSADGPSVPEVALAGEPVAGRDASGRLEVHVFLKRE